MHAEEVHKLSPRQKEILRLLLNGFDAKSAARELGISIHTVNEHLREARRQLGVSSSRGAARLVAQAEPVPPNSLGPNDLGVTPPEGIRFWLRRLSPNRRAAYTGVSLVMFLALAALTLSFANGGALSKHADAAAPAISAQPRPGTKNDSFQSREIRVGPFDRLKVSGPFKVGVLVGEGPAKVELLGPPAQLADTIATVEGGILTIRFREGATWSWNAGDGMNIVVFTPDLAAVAVEGAAEVEIHGVRGDMFEPSTDAAGSISIQQLDAGNVQLATGGSGGITVDGKARDGTYVINGSGSIDAKRLRVENASIAIGGAGSAYADVSGTANVSVNGSGRVEVVGGARCMEQPTNSTHVECR